jgi:hypothetical protein
LILYPIMMGVEEAHMRVIVTGSRTWRAANVIREKLEACLETSAHAGDELVVVHGDCRSGADTYAEVWARWHQRRGHPVIPEAHPANWEGPCRDTCRPGHRRPDPRGWDVCPQAGFTRNEEMVALGAELCLAFIADNSKGASHCARIAEEAGIHTLRFAAVVAGPVQLPLWPAPPPVSR